MFQDIFSSKTAKLDNLQKLMDEIPIKENRFFMLCKKSRLNIVKRLY